MIYLILDSNTWIYLANNKDPLSDNSQEDLHFKLFEKLLQKVEDGSIKILVNDIIEKEWIRNKQSTSELIIKYKNKLKHDLEILKRIQGSLNGAFSDELNSIKIEYIKVFEGKISKNTTHIINVESLLNACVKFKVTSTTKSFCADWAVEKKAPFIGDKKNSMADALILFSSIEKIKTMSKIEAGTFPFTQLHKSIFISGNKNDFGSADNTHKIHSDLEPFLSEIDMSFFLSLPAALNFLDDTLFKETEIKKIEQEIEEFFEEYYCLVCTPSEDYEYLNVIHFSSSIEVLNETNHPVDPNQLELALLDLNEKNQIKEYPTQSVKFGKCCWCNTNYIQCKNCSEIFPITKHDFEIYKCEGCGLFYQIISEYIGSGMFEENIRIISSNSKDELQRRNSTIT